MSREELIAAINEQYPGWDKKLRNMSNGQLFAIFQRLRSAGKKKPSHHKNVAFRTNVTYIYECQGCYAQYETDNPEESECRFCGTERPQRGRKRRTICQVSRSSTNS